MQNVNTINGSHNSTSNKQKAFEERDFSPCLLIDLDILENVPTCSNPHKKRWINLGFVNSAVHTKDLLAMTRVKRTRCF